MPPRLSIALTVLALTACATTNHNKGSAPAGAPVQLFPDNAALQKIARNAQQTPPLGLQFGGHPTWQLKPSETAAPEQGQAAALGPELAARASAQYSEALGCVAHELARSIAEHGALPASGVRRFISGRCGAWISSPAARTWLINVPPGSDDAEVEAQLRSTLASLSPDQVGMTQGMHIGVGAARSKNQLALVATYGAPLVELEEASRIADASGKVTLRGRLTGAAWLAQAFINRGALRVEECTLDPAFALPKFSLTCALDPGDDHAWVQLLAVPPGRLVGNSVLEILALRTPDAARSYQPLAELGRGVASGPAAFTAAAVQVLNGVRAQAGLGPLSLADAQSEIASQVTLPFFQSMLAAGADADKANNEIMLGLLAGWSVQGGTIQAAQLAVNLSEQPGDAHRWVASALELPSGRAVLLDAKASTLALGLSLQPEGVAALAVTYRFTDPKQDLHEVGLDVLERLKAVRDARKLGDTIAISDTPGLQDALRQIQTRDVTPQQALQRVLEDTSRAVGRSVQGFVWETYALDGLEFPDALLKEGPLYIGVGIAQYKPEGAAWAQYAVLFAVVGNGG